MHIRHLPTFSKKDAVRRPEDLRTARLAGALAIIFTGVFHFLLQRPTSTSKSILDLDLVAPSNESILKLDRAGCVVHSLRDSPRRASYDHMDTLRSVESEGGT